MKRRKGPAPSPQLKAVLAAAAAMTANASEPRRHHLVPQFYLDRWAEDERVRVTDLDAAHSFMARPAKVLVETDYYRVNSESVEGGSPVTWEVWLSAVEGAAAGVFRAVDSGGLDSLNDVQWTSLLEFLAVQVTRSRSYRFQARWMMGPGLARIWELDKPGGIENFLERGGESPTPERVAEVRAYFESAEADPWSVPSLAEGDMSMSMRAASGLVEAFQSRKFAIYRTSIPLITSDEPIALLHESMGADHPSGGGYMGAPILVFPWSPNEVLAMFRQDLPVLRSNELPLDRVESLELNRVLAGNAHRHTVELPSRRLAGALYIPARKDPTRIVTLTSTDGGEMLWMPAQGRWSGERDAPTRPVQAWWPAVVPRPPRPSEAELARNQREYWA